MPPFEGRTIHLVSDLSLTEQGYLYDLTKDVKSGKVERKEGKKQNVYLMFEEESTRTKDSFRNAAGYHGMGVNDIPETRKLFNKEAVTDVVKMFTSYSVEQSVFVIRSPMEGMCRWLENVMSTRTPKPSFINAGDGRHTHPTLEYVDAFTLLELKGFNKKSIHLALVGDLLNGRTAHSKVDGLKIFNEVTVDLIAPTELQYPVEYKAKMESNGFTVNTFSSIDDYLNSGSTVADVWSFSRLQMSRIGEEAQGHEEELLKAVSFKPQWKKRLPEGCKFLQTLPRDVRKPLVPYEFDNDELNAWDQASANGYWVRIVLLGMLTGRYGASFTPTSPAPTSLVPPSEPATTDFVKSIPPRKTAKSIQTIIPFTSGVVIDHISRGASEEECWSVVEAARTVMGWLDELGSQGVYTFDTNHAKGVISIPDLPHESLNQAALKKLAALAPGCTVNMISEGVVVKKLRLAMPARVYGFPSVSCKNVSCVSNPRQNQPDVLSDFVRVPFYVSTALKCALPAYEIRLKGQLASLSLEGNEEAQESPRSPSSSGHYLFVCRYCMWPHFHSDIWRA